MTLTFAPNPEHRDPFPYTGEIRRADGCAPFNHYLWPLHGDWYWANRDLEDHRVSSRWNFSVVALADGRWLADGFVREDESRMRFFATREAALRHSAAQLLHTIRAARHWDGPDSVSPDQCRALVAWVFGVLGRPAPVIYVPPPPPRPPATSLLELMEAP